MEAMLFSLDVMNSNKIIPGIKLGAFIHDDCDRDSVGLEKAVDFVKGDA